MRQGRLAFPLLAGVALLVASLAAPLPAESARNAAAAPAAASAKAKRNTLRQFTGWVTELDENTITVEKRGKKPQTRVFTRHPDMRTTGDLEEDARVTVYYRDEGGHPVAHRVVVKSSGGASAAKH